MEILLVRCQAAAPWQGCIQPRPQQQQRAYLFEVESLGLLSGEGPLLAPPLAAQILALRLPLL